MKIGLGWAVELKWFLCVGCGEWWLIGNLRRSEFHVKTSLERKSKTFWQTGFSPKNFLPHCTRAQQFGQGEPSSPVHPNYFPESEPSHRVKSFLTQNPHCPPRSPLPAQVKQFGQKITFRALLLWGNGRERKRRKEKESHWNWSRMLIVIRFGRKDWVDRLRSRHCCRCWLRSSLFEPIRQSRLQSCQSLCASYFEFNELFLFFSGYL